MMLSRFFNTLWVSLVLALVSKLAVPIAFTKRFNIFAGFLLGTYFLRWAILHSLATLLVTYAFSSHKKLVVIFNWTYLLWGYYNNSSASEYDMDWTLPQCFLCLKMCSWVSVAANNSNEKNKTWLSLLEYGYWFPFFISGPPYSYEFFQKHHRPFVVGSGVGVGEEDEETKTEVTLPSSYCHWDFATTLAQAVLFYLISRILQFLQPSNHNNNIFDWRLWVQMVTMTHTMVFQYFAVWCFTASVGILMGLPRLESLNVNAAGFWKTVDLKVAVSCWNIHTHHWAKQHIYKNCKVWNHKGLSSFVTLSVLAVWHGFSVGYFWTFLLEFLWLFIAYPPLSTVFFNDQFNGSWCVYYYSSYVAKVLIGSWTLTPFILKDGERCWQFFSAFYWLPFWLPLLIGLVGHLASSLLLRNRKVFPAHHSLYS